MLDIAASILFWYYKCYGNLIVLLGYFLRDYWYREKLGLYNSYCGNISFKIFYVIVHIQTTILTGLTVK